jgi:hypothetical protein
MNASRDVPRPPGRVKEAQYVFGWRDDLLPDTNIVPTIWIKELGDLVVAFLEKRASLRPLVDVLCTRLSSTHAAMFPDGN